MVLELAFGFEEALVDGFVEAFPLQAMVAVKKSA
jgi:hypothetical protein